MNQPPSIAADTHLSRPAIAGPVLALLAALAGCGRTVTTRQDDRATPASRPLPATAPALDGAADLGRLLDFRRVIAAAKDKVFPAVVFIKCLRTGHESGEKVTAEVAGSGVIISPSGEVLTNWHVVDKAAEVRCLLYDGRAMNAKVLGTDKDTDLALLQLALPPGSEAVPCAELGDSATLKEGDFVMAMGAPWGLSRSVSIGIVSCVRRYLHQASQYNLWLQTDASISPGNSGGPLVNTAGQVVGITTLGAMIGGDMGFAVPSETVRHVADQLRAHGKVNWSWTGIQIQPLRDFNRNIYFEGTEGVIVAETDPDSPACRAGILPRDRLLKIDSRPVSALTEEDLPAVRRRLGLLARGRPVTLELLRDGKALALTITPREKGKVEGDEYDCKRWDMTVKTINEFDNPDLYFYQKKGVFVLGVKYPGNASAARLRPQDIILKIDGKDVTSLEDLEAIHREALADVRTKHRAVLTVLRGGLHQQIVMDFSRDYEKE